MCRASLFCNAALYRSRPAAVAQASGVIDVFWRGSAGHHLWQAQYNPGGPRLGQAARPGRAAQLGARAGGVRPGTLTMFWPGQDGHLWVIRRNPGHRWAHPANLGTGRLGGAPAATGLASGEVDVFWPAKSHASGWQLSYLPGHGWGTAHDLPAGVSAGPVAVAAPATGVDVFWKGSNGTLWWAVGHGARWARPAPVEMVVLGSAPFAAGSLGVRLTCSGRGPWTGTCGRPGTGEVPGPGRLTWAARSADRHGVLGNGTGECCLRLTLKDY